MTKESFYQELVALASDDQLLDFCRKRVIHGTPFVFKEREDSFYSFRKRLANQFTVPFHEIYIVGSGKLGFSPHKGKDFDLDSDIDVAIVSTKLFDEIMELIRTYQMQLRKSRRKIGEWELQMYHEFLEYVAMGWMRPDKLPVSFQMGRLKSTWFDYFEGISYGKSEIGDYKVTAGAFKSYHHLEMYLVSGMAELRTAKSLKGMSNVKSN